VAFLILGELHHHSNNLYRVTWPAYGLQRLQYTRNGGGILGGCLRGRSFPSGDDEMQQGSIRRQPDFPDPGGHKDRR
jgi:hypothetical protein